MRKRLFVGLSKNKKTYVLTARCDETKQIETYQGVIPSEMNMHDTLIYILNQYLQIADAKEEIVYYSNNNIVSFEWETEIKKDHQLSRNTKKNIEEWKKVESLVKVKKIKLSIVGNDSPLSVLGKLGLNES